MVRPAMVPGPPVIANPVGDDPGIIRLPSFAPSIAPPPVAQDWPLSIEEAIAIALQNSPVVRIMDGREVRAAPTTALDPMIERTRIDEALAAFDISAEVTCYSGVINEPPDSFFGPGILLPNRRDEVGLNAALNKVWQYGTRTRAAYNPPLGYLYVPGDSSSGLFNPTYTANVEISIRQPVLRGFGAEVNAAPITVAQLRTDQSAWEFKSQLLTFLRDVEEAYWQLHAARMVHQAVGVELPLMDEVVRLEEAHLDADRVIRADVAKAKSQLHALRQRYAATAADAAETELRLRNLLGLPPYDGRTIIPASSPITAPLMIDADSAYAVAMDCRPEVIRQRLTVQVRQVELLVARNGHLPQVDLLALYRTTGVEQRLDRALSMMAGNDYHDWQFGATLAVPLGRRASAAALRAAELQVRREHALLQEAAYDTVHRLAISIRRLQDYCRQYQEAELRVRETREWVQGAHVRHANPPPRRIDASDNSWLLIALDDYLLALKANVEAQTDAAELLAQYNAELARLEETQGTLLMRYQVCVANDPGRQLDLSQTTRPRLPPNYAMPAPNDLPASRCPMPAERPSSAPPRQPVNLPGPTPYPVPPERLERLPAIQEKPYWIP